MLPTQADRFRPKMGADGFGWQLKGVVGADNPRGRKPQPGRFESATLAIDLGAEELKAHNSSGSLSLSDLAILHQTKERQKAHQSCVCFLAQVCKGNRGFHETNRKNQGSFHRRVWSDRPRENR